MRIELIKRTIRTESKTHYPDLCVQIQSFPPSPNHPYRRRLMKTVLSALVVSLFVLAGCTPEEKNPPNSFFSARKSNGSSPSKKEAREKAIAEAELDKEKQAFIFDAEHITFEIEQLFGKAWKQAFIDADVSRLGSFLFDEFSGETIDQIPWTKKSASVVTERTRNAKSNANIKSTNVDGKKLNDYLLSVSKSFGKLDRLKFRILKIAKPLETDPIWVCRILIDAVGQDSESKPMQYESEQTVVFELAQISEITSAPVISEWKIENETYRNADRYLTREVTDETLLNELKLADNWDLNVVMTEQYWFQYSVEDMNRDGKLDFAVACSKFFPHLLVNSKGHRFVDAGPERNLMAAAGPTRIGTSFGCAWIDYDNDGYPDLIMGNKLYHNSKGLRFKDVTFDSRLRFRRECMGILVADYDGDSLLDLYFLYQSPAIVKNDQEVPKQWVNETNTGIENQLWRNEGNGKFANVTKAANAGGGKRHSHAASWFFYDDDHYPDLYIANDFGRNVLLRNKGDGTFEDVSEQSKAAGYSTSMGVATGDFNNDGMSEIYVANMYSKMGRRIIGQVESQDYPAGIYEQIQGSCAGNRLYTRSLEAVGSADEFTEIGEAKGVHDVGWAFGPTLLDIDGDGLLDIYSTTGFMSFDRGKPDG